MSRKAVGQVTHAILPFPPCALSLENVEKQREVSPLPEGFQCKRKGRGGLQLQRRRDGILPLCPPPPRALIFGWLVRPDTICGALVHCFNLLRPAAGTPFRTTRKGSAFALLAFCREEISIARVFVCGGRRGVCQWRFKVHWQGTGCKSGSCHKARLD